MGNLYDKYFNKKKDEERASSLSSGTQASSLYGAYFGGNPRTQAASPTLPTTQRKSSLPVNVFSNSYKQSMTGKPATRTSNYLQDKVQDFLTESNKKYVTGKYNVASWKREYDDFMNQLDQASGRYNPAYISALKKAMEDTKSRMIPTKATTPAYELTGNEVRLSQIGINNKNLTQPSAPTKPFQTKTNLDRAIDLGLERFGNEKKIQDTAYAIAAGAPTDMMSNRDLEFYQKNWERQQQEFNRKASEWEANHAGEDKSIVQLESYVEDVKRQKEDEIANRPESERTGFGRIWSDEELQEINEAEAQASVDYNNRPTPTMPSLWQNTGVYGTASNLAGRELKNRNWQAQYAPYTLEGDYDANSRYERKLLDDHDLDLKSEDPKAWATRFGGDELKKYWEIYYEAVNGSSKAVDYLTTVKTQYGEIYPSADRFVEQYMSRDEVGMFNYIWKTQGQEAASEYVNGLNQELTRREYVAADEDLKQVLLSDPANMVLANIGSIPLNLATGVGNAIAQGIDMLLGREINPWNYQNVGQSIRNITSEAITQAVADAGGSETMQTLANMGYQAVMSGAESALSLMLGSGVADMFGLAGGAANNLTQYVSLGIMSSTAASSTLTNELMMGIPQDRAAVDALSAGAIEFLTEKIGMDNLFNGMWRGKGAWVTWAKQVLAEGSEELVGDLATDAIENLYDLLSGTNYSELNRRANAYILENGLAPASRQQVMQKLLIDRVQEYAQDFAIGSLSVITGEGSLGAISAYNNARIVTGHISLNNAPPLIALGQTFDPSTKAYKAATELLTKIESNNQVSSRDVRRLGREIYYETEAIEDNEVRHKAEEDMFEALGLNRFRAPDVQTIPAPSETPGIDPDAGEFEAESTKIAEREIQRSQDRAFVSSAIQQAIEGNPTADPSEVERVINAYVERQTAFPMRTPAETAEPYEGQTTFPMRTAEETTEPYEGQTAFPMREAEEAAPEVTIEDLSAFLPEETISQLTAVAERGLLAGAEQATDSMPIIEDEDTRKILQERNSATEETAVQEAETEAEPEETPAAEQPLSEAAVRMQSALTPEARTAFDTVIEEARADGSDVNEAATAFAEIYNAGLQRTTYRPTPYIRRMSQPTRERVYATAMRESIAYTNRLESQGFAKSSQSGTTDEKGLVTNTVLSDAIRNGDISLKTASTINRLGKMLGSRIVFISEDPVKNGEYSRENATITLALDSTFFRNATVDQAVLGTFGHELTHRLQDISPAAYQQLGQQVAQAMGIRNFTALVQHNQRLVPGMSMTYAQDEVIADFIGKQLFRDSSFADKFLDGITVETEEQRQKITGLRDLIRRVISWIRGEGKQLNVAPDTETVLQKIENTLTNLLNESAEAVALSNYVVDAENGDAVRYSVKETDQDTIEFLENQDHITTYKAMQVIDGKLYPPMAARTKGEDGKYHMVPSSTLGTWQRAVEDLGNAKFKPNGQAYYVLDKADGTSIEAAYNPYEHSSNLVLNDQFEGAYKRDNLVIVECEIPVSEMDGTYKAEHAKDSTGMLDWKAGVVAGKLKDNPRKVYLSRWLKPVRILSDVETAGMWADTLRGTGVKVPFNVVWPGLLSELENAGIEIDYAGSPGYQSRQKRAAEKTQSSRHSLRSDENPDIRYSRKDSAGNTLTEAQAEYFKDSKVRDDNGNLMVMYHGTPGEFTVFQDMPARNGRVYGNGFYFTNEKNDAFYWGGGAKLMEVYVNITNPYILDRNEKAPDGVLEALKNQYRNTYDKYSDPNNLPEFMRETGWYGTQYSREEYVDQMIRDKDNADSVFTLLDNNTEVLKQLGYDGVFAKGKMREVVAFYPEQIKNVSNQNPTENPDIRYSLRDTEVPDDFRSIVERNQQREQTRMFLDASADWRQEQTRLDTHKLRGSTEAMLKTYGDKLSKDRKDKIVQQVNALAYDILRKNADITDIEHRATKIAGDIVFQSAGVDDKAGRALMMNDPQTEEAIDYLTNYILANIVSTQTQQGKRLQEQIEKNAKLKDTLKEVRQKRDQKIREGIESRKRQQTARTESKLRKSILDRTKRLRNMPLGKANKALLNELVGEMNTDATHLTDGKKKRVSELLAWLESEKDNENLNVSDFVKRQLALAAQTDENGRPKYLDDLVAKGDINGLRLLNDALAELENEVRNNNRLIAENDRRDLREIAYTEANIIEEAPGTKAGLFRKLDSVMVQGTLSPMRFVRRLVGYNDRSTLLKLANSIDEGTRKQQDYQMRASKMFDKWMRDRKLTRKWAGSKADVITYEVTTFDGKKKQIQMTPAMRMTLYLASKDSGWLRHMVGADDPNGHIDGAGIHMPDMKWYKKGDLETAYSAKPDNSHKYRITKAFLNKIAADMTAEEKEFADAAHDFFNGMQKDAINAVSNELIGRDLALVDDYLPIDVDKNFTGVDYGAIQNDGSVAGIGSFKERVNSGAPVYVRDLTDILIKSINSTSAYVGLAIPIRNMNKLLGVNLGTMTETGQYLTHETSLNEAIDKKWGQTAKDYINKMLSDIQHPVKVQEDLEKAFTKLRGNYARSVLTLNLSVGLKQAASYPTAAAVVGWEPLAKAMGNLGKVDLDLIAKYTPLLWYRSRGFINPDLEGIKSQNDIFSNLPKGLDWITGVDFLTTRKLWKAAEYYVQENQPGLYKKGAGIYGQTDAYYTEVAKVYNRIIEETQPNYTPWQRPQYLRSQSGIVRTLMMFKTQPMQNFNILYDAIGNFKAKQRAMKANGSDAEVRAQFKKASQNLRRAVTSQIGQLITFAAMTMAWNLFRRKKEKYEDEEGNFSIETMLKSMGKDIGSGLFGMVPFGADAWSLISSLAFGDRYYGFESVTDSALGDLGSAVKTTWDTISKMVTSDEPFSLTTYKNKIRTVGGAVSKIFGIPAENIYNLFTALYMRGRDLTENKYMADYYALAWTEDPAQNKKQFVEIAWRAYKNGDMEAYEDIKDVLVNDLGLTPEDITSDMKTFYAGQFHDQNDPSDVKLGDAYHHLYELYKDNSPEYEGEYNVMLELGFTDEAIKKGVREQMRDAAGLASVKDLEETYVTPTEAAEYEESMKAIRGTKLYQTASESDKQLLEGYAGNYNESESKAWEKARNGVSSGAFSFEDYMEFMLEMERANQANTEGSLSSYDKSEQLAAIKACGWSDTKAKRAWDYLPSTAKNPYEKESTSSSKKETKTTTPSTKKETPSYTPASTYSDDEVKQAEETTSNTASWMGDATYNGIVKSLTIPMSGRSYTYYDVPQEVFDGMKAAEDPTAYFNQYIKGVYRYTRN